MRFSDLPTAEIPNGARGLPRLRLNPPRGIGAAPVPLAENPGR
jgi:hypothetical protein